MTNEAVANQEQIADIKRRMGTGELSYEAAKAEAQPIIDRMNAKAKEIAKKYNQKARKMSFSEIMR